MDLPNPNPNLVKIVQPLANQKCCGNNAHNN